MILSLNRLTKHDVKIGDELRFTNGDAYIVTGITPSGKYALSFTIQDKKTKQTIYGYPSSQLYGCAIIKEENP